MPDKAPLESTVMLLDNLLRKNGYFITQAEPPSEINTLSWHDFSHQECGLLDISASWCNVERRGIQNLVKGMVDVLDTILKTK